MTYRPRRQSKRWLDGDCPPGVLAVLDNKGVTADRYTVIYAEIYGGTGRDGYMWGRNMSEAPSHPQGVGVSFEMRPHEVAALRYREKHRYAKWSSLPDAVKAVVRADLGARA